MAFKIGIACAKGGVGKTTTVINLGHAIADFGREVILLDADLRRPNLGLLLGYEHTPKCVHSAIYDGHSVEECTYVHPCGVRIVPGNIYNANVIRPEDHARVHDLAHDLHNASEIILLDMPPGIDESHKQLFTGLDAIIIVTTPEKVSVHDAWRTANLARDVGVNVLGVVVNKDGEHTNEIETAFIEHQIRAPVIGVIPYSIEVLDALRHKHPVTFTDVNCKASIAYKMLAANIIGEKYEPVLEGTKISVVDSVLQRIGLKD